MSNICYADDEVKNLVIVRRKLLNLITAYLLKYSVEGKMQRACWDANLGTGIVWMKINQSTTSP